MATKITQKKTTKTSSAASGESKKTASKSSKPTHDAIAKRAYKLWQERGGGEMDNWLEAEKQLQ